MEILRDRPRRNFRITITLCLFSNPIARNENKYIK